MANTQLYDFYRPHKRVSEDGSHPDTGEFLPSLTKQSFKDECDINNIVKAFSTTGMVSHISARAAEGAFMDLPDQVDFQEAIHTVRLAEERFMLLPAKIRERFGNEPSAFLEFINDPKNRDEAKTLGLLKLADTPPPAPAPAPIAPPPGKPPAEPSGA